MSLTKDMWMDEIEEVGEYYVADLITKDEGVKKLVSLGLDRHEAETMLDEAVS